MTWRKPLTPRQEKYLKWIESYIRLEGIAPTAREVAQGLNIGSLNAVHGMMVTLERKGWLRRRPGVIARNWHLTYRGTYSQWSLERASWLTGTCSGSPSGQCQGSRGSWMCAPPGRTASRTG